MVSSSGDPRPVFECLTVGETDMVALTAFFRECYGPETVFQDPEFLRWYLAGAPEGGLESLIAIEEGGAVVAHYGGLPRMLMLNGRPVPMVWGVSAYTLPKWRSLGLGKRLAEMMLDRYEVFGVIGFSAKTADFYEARGFNVFGRRRFHRFVRVLRESAYEVAGRIGVDPEMVRERLPVAASGASSSPEVGPMRTQAGPLLPFGATTLRSAAYLNGRFLANPFLTYLTFQIQGGERPKGYLVARLERLAPTEYLALRIIDLDAEQEAARVLLNAVVRRGIEEGASFIDFAYAGTAFDNAFAELFFVPLLGDDAGLLPQVTTPIEARGNQDYLGLFSRQHREEVAALTHDDI